MTPLSSSLTRAAENVYIRIYYRANLHHEALKGEEQAESTPYLTCLSYQRHSSYVLAMALTLAILLVASSPSC